MTGEGVLLHQCTGNMVCPNDNPVTYGTKLVIKNGCTKNSATFKRIGWYCMENIYNISVNILTGRSSTYFTMQ
jgi:hypothetical protein